MGGRQISGLEQLAAIASRARLRDKTIALCHGTFDLLHMGHIRHLQHARAQADLLFVSVTADRFVNKGPDRPVFGEDLRAEALAALACVDGVVIHQGTTGVEVIKAVRSNVYADGMSSATQDMEGTSLQKAEYDAVESIGGRVYFTAEITFSSSNLLNQHFDVFAGKVRDFRKDFGERHTDSQIIESLRSLRGLKVLQVLGDVGRAVDRAAGPHQEEHSSFGHSSPSEPVQHADGSQPCSVGDRKIGLSFPYGAGTHSGASRMSLGIKHRAISANHRSVPTNAV